MCSSVKDHPVGKSSIPACAVYNNPASYKVYTALQKTFTLHEIGEIGEIGGAAYNFWSVVMKHVMNIF